MTIAVSDRESFLVRLLTVPKMPADVVVVFCGEDGASRTDYAIALMKAGAAPLLYLTGGLEDEERYGALRARSRVFAAGVSPERVLLNDSTLNTRDQAIALAGLATLKQWNRVILVASAYHLPRAFLTVVKALTEQGIEERVCVIPAASDGDWTAEQLAADMAKLTMYQDHVATYEQGLAYLSYWDEQ